MKNKVNIRKIASDLGVSIATVSRVLNNKPDVNSATREKVLTYLQELEYQPQLLPFDLHLIGIVDKFEKSTIQTYYFSNLLAGVDETIHKMGYNTILIHSDLIEREIREYGQVRLLNRLDGIIWSSPVFTNRYLEIVKSHNVACVIVNNCEADINVHIIESDNYTASKQAVEYLLGQGHKSIGFLGGRLQGTNHRDRFEGYKRALENAGINIDKEWIIDDITLWNDEGGAEGMHRLLSRSNVPTSVILCSDILAAGAYRAAKERGFSIPDDISIISFDDFPLAPYLDPPLTTFRQPIYDMGVMAAERLLQMITASINNFSPERTYVRMPLIVRKSVSTKKRLEKMEKGIGD